MLGVILVRDCRGKHQLELCLAALGCWGVKAPARGCKAVSRGGSGLAAAGQLGAVKL